MDPLKFEGLIADYYRRQGYRVVECGTGGTKGRYDGGIDLKLYRDDEYIVVQCKRYTNSVVKHNDVHQLLGIMHTEGATRAIFINSGEYSRHALQKLHGIPNFEMIDGVQLRHMLGSLDAAIEDVSSGGGIEPTFGSKHRTAASDYWRDWSDTIPNAHSRTHASRTPKARSSPDNGFRLITIVVVGIVLGSCIRHFSSQTSRSGVRASEASTVPVHYIRTSEPTSSLQPASESPKPAIVPRQPTKAEIRESQRKADEAMEILKKNTPEM